MKLNSILLYSILALSLIHIFNNPVNSLAMTAKPICNTLTRCLMIPAITLMLFAACSDSPADPRQNPTSAFSFRLSAAQLSSSSRALSYDLMETSVDEGTLIGCVIAYANTDGSLQYVANSAWEYHTEGLLLKKLFNEANDPIDIDSWENTIILPASHPDAVNTAVEPSPYDLTLKEGHKMCIRDRASTRRATPYSAPEHQDRTPWRAASHLKTGCKRRASCSPTPSPDATAVLSTLANA